MIFSLALKEVLFIPGDPIMELEGIYGSCNLVPFTKCHENRMLNTKDERFSLRPSK